MLSPHFIQEYQEFQEMAGRDLTLKQAERELECYLKIHHLMQRLVDRNEELCDY